jgi:hypothetical protein
MNHLRLHAHVHFVPGQPQGALYDLRHGRVRTVPPVIEAVLSAFSTQPLSTLLADFFNHDEALLQGYVDFLVGGDWAFLTPRPERFPLADVSWETPFALSTAIVAHDFCKPYALGPLLKGLSRAGCRHLELQLHNYPLEEGSASPWHQLGRLFERYEFRRGTLVLGAGGGAKNIRPEDLHRLLNHWPRIGTVVLLGQNQRQDTSLHGRSYHLRRVTDLKAYAAATWRQHPDAHFVGPAYFREARVANPFFNRRIAVDCAGNFRNDLLHGGDQTYGRVGECSVTDVLANPEFLARWKAGPDAIANVRSNPLRYCLRYDRALVRSPGDDWAFASA